MSGEAARNTVLFDREQHTLEYFQACDSMINELVIKTAIFTSLHNLFDFLQPKKKTKNDW